MLCWRGMQSDGQAASKRLALPSYSRRVVLSGRFPLRVGQKRPGEFSIAVVHSENKIGGQPGKGHRAQLTRISNESKKAAGEFSIIPSARIVPVHGDC